MTIGAIQVRVPFLSFLRLAGCLDQWIHLVGIESKFEDLKALLVRERFLESCGGRLAICFRLRERAANKLDEVVSLADHCIVARSGKRTGIMDAVGDWMSTASGLNRVFFNSAGPQRKHRLLLLV